MKWLVRRIVLLVMTGALVLSAIVWQWLDQPLKLQTADAGTLVQVVVKLHPLKLQKL